MNYCSAKNPENCGCSSGQIKESAEKSKVKVAGKTVRQGHCNTCTSSCCDFKRMVSPDCSIDPDGCGQLSTDPPGKAATIQTYGKYPLQSPGIYLTCDKSMPGFENCDKPPYNFLDFKETCDRWLGKKMQDGSDRDYLYYKLTYVTPGITPNLQLKIFASPDQSADGPVPSQYLLTHERLDFFDFVAHPTNVQKTVTVIHRTKSLL